MFPSQLQVHMALQLCPVLGDNTYAAQVGTVLGQRFLWPATTTKPQRQVGPQAPMPAPLEGDWLVFCDPVELCGSDNAILPQVSFCP